MKLNYITVKCVIIKDFHEVLIAHLTFSLLHLRSHKYKFNTNKMNIYISKILVILNSRSLFYNSSSNFASNPTGVVVRFNCCSS